MRGNLVRRFFTNTLLALLLATTVITACIWINRPASTRQVNDRFYVRIAAVYAGDLDTRFYIPEPTLETSGQSFLGKPILMGHDWKDPQACIGRIVAVGTRFDKGLKTKYIEVIAYIDGRDAIDRIKRGLFYAVSIGISDIKATCGIDGVNILIDQRHELGRYYNMDGKPVPARAILLGFEGREISFINVPGSPNARVLEWSPSPLKLSESK